MLVWTRKLNEDSRHWSPPSKLKVLEVAAGQKRRLGFRCRPESRFKRSEGPRTAIVEKVGSIQDSSRHA